MGQMKKRGKSNHDLPSDIAVRCSFVLFGIGTQSKFRKHFIQPIGHEDFGSFRIGTLIHWIP